jgi:hypothetical protein
METYSIQAMLNLPYYIKIPPHKLGLPICAFWGAPRIGALAPPAARHWPEELRAPAGVWGCKTWAGLLRPSPASAAPQPLWAEEQPPVKICPGGSVLLGRWGSSIVPIARAEQANPNASEHTSSFESGAPSVTLLL